MSWVEKLKDDMSWALGFAMEERIKKYAPDITSPIEFIMMQGLIAVSISTHEEWPSINGKGRSANTSQKWKIETQKKIGRYRADFVLTDSLAKCSVVIECDGHDYHERTKEQAAHDRARDRELQAQGYLVLRYTGSEIHADPFGCALDVQTKIYEWRNMIPAAAQKRVEATA